VFGHPGEELEARGAGATALEIVLADAGGSAFPGETVAPDVTRDDPVTQGELDRVVDGVADHGL
jgi:hypothetical protein